MKQEMTSADVAALVSEFIEGMNSLGDAKIGKIYQPVPEAKISPLDAGENELAGAFASSDTNVVRTIAN
ncbi:MAG TPA: hypothetical protein C5S50_08915 [Methanosarcinaceae archaeon]|nr:hypothetical protein [Methanosarcinaceae archaeon]